MAAMNWPYHLKVIYKDGMVAEHDLTEDAALDYAKFASTKPGVERVDASVTFVAGEAVPSQATADSVLAELAEPDPHPTTSQCECGGIAHHAPRCCWREGYGSKMISDERGWLNDDAG